MKKRGLAMLLAVCMVLALVPATAEAAGNFPRTATYRAGQFSDVTEDNWFAGAVKDCYELGLMSGVGAGAFSPSGKFTVAQALTVAARLHNMFRGGDGVIPSAPGSWYAGAVNYCVENGIVTEEEFKGSYLRTATRGEMAHLISAAMTEDALAEKNQVTDLPDVSSKDMYYEDILRLYQAGIVGGSDKFGSFKPYSSITRAEVATIVARSVLVEQRLALKLTPYTTNGSALPVYTWNYKEYGYNSGYEYFMSCGRMAFCDSADENNNNKKWGYLDSLGNVVIPAQYSRVERFREGRAIVESMDGKYGVIDTDGKAIVPVEYNTVEWISSAKLNELGGGAYKWKNGAYLAHKNNYSAVFQADGKKLVENQGGIYALGDGTFGLNGNDKTPARLYVQGTVVSIPGMKDSPREKISGENVFYTGKYASSGALESAVVVTVSEGKATVYQNVKKISKNSPLMVVEEGGKYYLWNMLTNKRALDQGANDPYAVNLIGDEERYNGTDLAALERTPNGYDTVSYLVNSNGLVGEYAGSFRNGSKSVHQAVEEYIKAQGGFKKIWDSYKDTSGGVLAFGWGSGWVKGINPDGKLWIITWENIGPESSSLRNTKLTVKVEGEQVFELQWWEVIQGDPTPNIFVLPDGSGHIFRDEQHVMIDSSTVEIGEWVTQPGVNFNTYAGKDASFAKCFENGERFEITVKNEWKNETKDGKTYQNLYRTTTYKDRLFYFNFRDWWRNKEPIKIGGVTIDPPPETTNERIKSIDVSAYKEVVSLGEDCFMGRIDSSWYMIRK